MGWGGGQRTVAAMSESMAGVAPWLVPHGASSSERGRGMSFGF
jgi:hypothetical protein